MTRAAPIALAALVVIAACSAPAPGPGIDVDRALGHAAAQVAIGPRPGETPASRRAIEYIEGALAEIGVAVERVPVGTVEVPAIEILGHLFRPAHQVTRDDPNLVVRFGPPGRALLVIAHYDTVPTSAGAIDNAAAVGALIELASVLHAETPAQPILLAFTANEEVGLVGAEALAAARGDQVALAVALDLIGGTGELSINGASRRIGAAELGWIAAAADRAGATLRMPLPHRVVSRWWPQAERSDHGPFTRRGIRAVHLYHRGHDGEWIDRAYHSQGDTVARIDRGAVDELGRVLRAMTTLPVPAPRGDGFWLPLARNTVVPRWVLLAFELVLALVGLAGAVGRFDRRSRRDDSAGARRGLGLFAGVGCFALAIGATVAIERLTAGDHPAPWVHDPRPAAIGLALVLGGALGLATRLAARLAPWIGERRYLRLALVVPLVSGLSLAFVGAAELAWIWLVPAALLAVAPRLGRARLVAVAGALVPAALILAPSQLREAVWNGFWPVGVPLSVVLAALVAPAVAAAAWYLRSRLHTGPLGTLVLPVGCAVAISVGTVMLVRLDRPCSGPQFHEFHLACEMSTEVH
ncbi:MAG: M28 family peptidase [Kofleriaceae bacterium]